MQVGIFWPEPMGYVVAGAAELVRRNVEPTMYVERGTPAEVAHATSRGVRVVVIGDRDQDWLGDLAALDLAVICGWHRPLFRRAADQLAGKCPRLLYFDTQWSGSLRQRAGRSVARWFLRRRFDGCFVPGTRQAQFARRMGFRDEQIRRGSLTCDQVFADVPALGDTGLEGRRAFIFGGRLAPEKGIDTLLAAYELYRAYATDEPWGLVVAGTGNALDGRAMPVGVTLVGHLRAAELAAAMAAAACLVLPSRFEPFGVILLEAATAGLPIIATPVCGAVSEVVEPGRSGVLVDAEDVDGLAQAMADMAARSAKALGAMGDVGRAKAALLSPEHWADALLGEGTTVSGGAR